MQDLEDLWRPPGTLPAWARWLIALGCGVTVLVAAEGMRSLWDYGGYASKMSGFWFQNGLALGVAAAIALAWLPARRMARSLRVVVLLPLVHVVAMLVTAKMWSALVGDMLVFGCCSEWHAKVAVPPETALPLAIPAVALVAVAIKRRHGEWAHAMVMLALACVLLLGLWLPLASRWWLDGTRFASWDQLHATMEAPGAFAALVAIPPIALAIAFTWLAFRRPGLFGRHRATLRIAVQVMFAIAILAQLSMPDAGVVLYMNFVHVVLLAVFVAVVALVAFGVATWLGSRLAHRALRALSREVGVIRADVPGAVAGLEIASWLRGPRLAMRSFSVTTPRGDVPVAGANVLAAVPPSTTRLAIGEHAPLLLVGDRVEVAGRTAAAEGHPFRAMDAAAVEMVVGAGAEPYRFADVALVMWRPCIAYLAILIAVALPGLVLVAK